MDKEEPLHKTTYHLPLDKSSTSLWYGPTALFIFALIFIGFKFYFTTNSTKTISILITYSAVMFLLLPIWFLFVTKDKPQLKKWQGIAYIFFIPTAFLGLLWLLLIL